MEVIAQEYTKIQILSDLKVPRNPMLVTFFLILIVNAKSFLLLSKRSFCSSVMVSTIKSFFSHVNKTMIVLFAHKNKNFRLGEKPIKHLLIITAQISEKL